MYIDRQIGKQITDRQIDTEGGGKIYVSDREQAQNYLKDCKELTAVDRQMEELTAVDRQMEKLTAVDRKMEELTAVDRQMEKKADRDGRPSWGESKKLNYLN